MRYDCGVSFSFDQRELVQEVALRLRNLRLSVFMCDAEPQESGSLWAWLQSKYLSCDRIAVFVNRRYLERPITRRELQFFHSKLEARWAASAVKLFMHPDAEHSPLLFPMAFSRYSTADAEHIAAIMSDGQNEGSRINSG
jgi:hypothetical protein